MNLNIHSLLPWLTLTASCVVGGIGAWQIVSAWKSIQSLPRHRESPHLMHDFAFAGLSHNDLNDRFAPLACRRDIGLCSILYEDMHGQHIVFGMLLILVPVLFMAVLVTNSMLLYVVYKRHRRYLYLVPVVMILPIVVVWGFDLRTLFPDASLFETRSPEFRLGVPFSDGIVLQGKPLPVHIWGTAPSDTNVSVSLHLETTVLQWSVRADEEGNWLLTAKLPVASAVGSLNVKSGNSYTAVSVYVGMVFLCSGQSNMPWPMSLTKPHVLRINPYVHMWIDTQHVWKPADDVKMLNSFSAVCQAFATQFHSHLPHGQHVGVVDTSVGGMPIAAFMHRDDLVECSSFPIFGSDKEFAERRYLEMQHLMPMSVSGFLWWQGESDMKRTSNYDCLFSLLIRRMRLDFQSFDAKFVFVRLPSFGRNVATSLPRFREVQTTVSTMDGVGFVPSEDVQCNELHPVDKTQVGLRLATVMRSLLLNSSVHWMPPVLSHVEWHDTYALLHISHVSYGGHLTLRNQSTCAQSVRHSRHSPFPGASTFDGMFWNPAELVPLNRDTLLLLYSNVNSVSEIAYGYASVPDLYIQDSNTQLPLLACKVMRPAQPYSIVRHRAL